MKDAWWKVGKQLPNDTYKSVTGCGNLYTTVIYKDKKPTIVIARLGKAGGCASAFLSVISEMVSDKLIAGEPLSDTLEVLRGVRCPSPKQDVPSCIDAMAFVLGVAATQPKLQDS